MASRRFQSVGAEFFEVGHTRNLCDQRFSILAPHLSRSPILETPEDFMKVMREKLKPPEGRELTAEKIETGHNWTELFGELGITISGLATTHLQPVVNHAWRVIRRADMADYKHGDDAAWEIEIPSAAQLL